MDLRPLRSLRVSPKLSESLLQPVRLARDQWHYAFCVLLVLITGGDQDEDQEADQDADQDEDQEADQDADQRRSGDTAAAHRHNVRISTRPMPGDCSK